MASRTRAPFCALVALAAGLGCSTLINPDVDQLGAGVDAGVGRLDAGPSGLPSGDAGALASDAGGQGCVRSEPTCVGDSVVTCSEGRELTRDCQDEGGYCLEAGCRPWVCNPGSRVCNPGLESVRVCDARGASSVDLPCTEGACDPATGACMGLDRGACEAWPSIGSGETRRVDLCSAPDDNTFRAGADCDPRIRASSGDRIFALEVETTGVYVIELEDDAFFGDIDTVLYVRRQCDEPRSQLACSDDTACDGGGFPFDDDCRDGVQLGLSRLELSPGTYYIVVDAFIYERGGFSSQCGNVQLRVNPPDSPFP